jgi:hypothetical protein
MSDRVSELEAELAALKVELRETRAELAASREEVRELTRYRAAVEASPAGTALTRSRSRAPTTGRSTSCSRIS